MKNKLKIPRKKGTAVCGALLMCLCLSLFFTGCGEKTEEEASADFERAASVNNGSLTDDSTAISVGKTTVSYAEYKIYDFFMRNQYEKVLGGDVWKYKLDKTGRTIEQDAVEDVLRLIIQVKVINKTAAGQQVTLAPDEKEEADNRASKYCESVSDKVKKEHGMSVALVSQIFEENKLAEKMYNIVIGKADVKLSDEQCRAARVQLIYLKADDSNREEVRKKAAALQMKAKSANSFYTLARDNTQAEEVEFLIGRQDGRAKLADVVLRLKENEVSGVVEESDGFYIAYCVSENSKAIQNEYKNQVVEERQNKAFASAYKGWADSYKVKVSRSLLVK